MNSSSIIPDISYYLIFQFLPLQDLAHISSCCHKFKRLCSDTPFRNLCWNNRVTSCQDYFKQDLFYKSPLHLICNDLKLNPIDLNSQHILSNLSCLRLKSLRVECDLSQMVYQNIRNLPPIQRMFRNCSSTLERLHIGEFYLQNSNIQEWLCIDTNKPSALNKLSMSFVTNDQSISFIQQFGKLEELKLTIVLEDDIQFLDDICKELLIVSNKLLFLH
jgi:hypothetical protein